MTEAARHLIESFDALPQADQQEVLTHLLRRAVEVSYTAPSDDDLVFAADEVFQQLDRHEAQEG